MTRAAIITGIVLVTVSCSSGKSTSTATPTSTGSQTVTTGDSTTTSFTTQPCTPAPTYTADKTTTHTIDVDGTTRQFLVHIPPDPRVRIPLVVDFHGAGSNMQQQDAYSAFDPVGDRGGFVVATPNGADAAVRRWRYPGETPDVAFARALVADLVAHACVDSHLVIATGISSGGAMTVSLACQASDAFDAFSAVAADFYVPALCDAAKPRPMLFFHGTADPIVPYGGGKVNVSFASGTVKPAEESAAQWAAHNKCNATPTLTKPTPHVVEHAWTGCTQPVTLFEIEGGGHTWPGARIEVTRLGATSREISATDQVVRLITLLTGGR